MSSGEHTRLEIASQPAVWQATLEGFDRQYSDLIQRLEPIRNNPFLVTGCGSTHYAALGASAVLRQRGFHALASPASDLVFFPGMFSQVASNLLAISRSGTTTETLWAVNAHRQLHPDGSVITITTQPESPLAKSADIVLAAPDAQEKSVAQTRSFTSMYLLPLALGAALSGDHDEVKKLYKLPLALQTLLERAGSLPRELGEAPDLQRFFFLGGGPLYGLACEAMLKTKEMTRSWAEAFHPLEFRHGPMSVVNEQTLVIGLVSDSEQEAEARVLREMQKLGARILVLTEDASMTNWEGLEYVIELRSGLDEWQRGALYLPFIQWMDFYRTLAKGLDPDQPVNLTAVVEL